MSDIQINVDISDVKRKLKKLRNIKNGVPTATMRALNRTVAGMKTDAGKKITAIYTIKKQKDFKEEIYVKKTNINELSVEMRSEGRPVSSIKFKHKANKSPGKRGGAAAFLHVKKSKSGGLLNGDGKTSKAFIATMQNGMTGIFQRTGEAPLKIKRKGKGVSRYLKRSSTKKGRENIEQVYSPGVVDMLGNSEVSEFIQEEAVVRFNKELDHQVKHLLSRQKG